MPAERIQDPLSKDPRRPDDGCRDEAESEIPITRHTRSGKIVRGSLKGLALPQILDTRRSASPIVIVRDHESPWDTFQRVFSCKLAGTVMICVRRSRPSRTEAIRKYPEEISERVLYLFRHAQHENIISAIECFRTVGDFYARVDDLPLTLEHLVNLYIEEHQLASIISQILSGLSRLIMCGFEHTALTCSNILLGLDGTVKIAALELCVESPPSQSLLPSIKGLVGIMKQLMQLDERPAGAGSVERWALDSYALDFLTTTCSSRSMEALAQHPWITGQKRPSGELVGLARLALIATKTSYP